MEDKIMTREDVFRIMEEELSDEERKAVMDCEDIVDFHFSVGIFL